MAKWHYAFLLVFLVGCASQVDETINDSAAPVAPQQPGDDVRNSTGQQTFTGTLRAVECYSDPDVLTTIQRCMPYKLDGVTVIARDGSMDSCVGKTTRIVGEQVTYELEGETLTEIDPESFSCE